MIDFDIFYEWCDRHFDGVKVHGNEIKLNSIYDPDNNDCKHKLWCNPTGQTKKGDRADGVYHCWISGKKGTLVGLVMDVEKCPYDRACEILGADGGVSDMEEQLEAFFAAKKTEHLAPKPPTKTLAMPEGVTLIKNLSPWNRARKDAEYYLNDRKFSTDGFYVGVSGDFRERVVIPYYDRDGNLIYYNGRYIGISTKPSKYKGPDKEVGVGKGDVVFMPYWSIPGTTLHVTEGEFDALVLHKCGFASCAVGGSHLTDYQQKILKDYNICLCGDIDKPGAGAVIRTGTQMLESGFKNLTFVRPPVGFKDWNELYKKFPAELVAKYVRERTKPFDLITAEQLFADYSLRK